MNSREMSLHKLLALVALSGVLPAALGACQKEQAAAPPAEQTTKAPAPADKNPGDATGNMQPQTDQNGGTNQKSQ